MSVRNLDALFAPRSIVLIGGSNRAGTVGAVLARNLFRGGFKGPILPVHATETAIEGVMCWRSIADLPLVPDLAVICAPHARIPALIGELGQRGCRAAVLVTADFSPGDPVVEAELTRQALQAARPHLMRIVGPDCLGLLVPGVGLNASFSPVPALPGDIACVTQSGAIATSLLDWASARGIGFSHMISLGDMADVDIGDLLDYLQRDPRTHAVLLYIEAVTSARKFMSAARAISRMKPVIVVKSGRHAAPLRVALSHSGALAGSDAVYDAAFRRAGMLRVRDMEEMFAAVETLARLPPLRGERLAIVGNSFGIGGLAGDALLDEGGVLADLSPATVQRLGQAGNPVVLPEDAAGAGYGTALEILLDDQGVDAVLMLNAPSALASSADAAEAVIATLAARPRGLPKRPVLSAWIGGEGAQKVRQQVNAAGLPAYATPTAAIRGFLHLVKYRRTQEILLQAPAALPSELKVDPAAVAAILAQVRSAGRDWLDEAEAKQVLAAYGIPVVRTLAVPDAAGVAAAAELLTPPLAVKIRSPDISHKSDVGGVVLDLPGGAAAGQVAAAMQARVAALLPEARIAGFTVQETVRRPGASELLLGATRDPVFGPVLLFGHGGVAVEVRADKALALPPLNMTLAREVIGRTRIVRQLQGFRHRPPADLDAVALALIRIGQLVIDHPEIIELDINPLLADETGVVALDARLRIAPAGAQLAPLAVPAYPKALEEDWVLKDGTELHLRPIRPEDAPAVEAMFSRLDPEDIRLRFFQPLKALPKPLVARLTQIDYDREMAFVACPVEGDAAGEIWGVVRLTCDPDGHEGEYAVLVRSDIKGRGLGLRLMQHICDYGRARGVGAITGSILRENERMIEIVRDMGFVVHRDPDDPGVVEVRLTIRPPEVSEQQSQP